MSITLKEPGVFLLDIRAWKDGRELRERHSFKGGSKAADMKHHELLKALQVRAKAGFSCSLKIKTFGDAIDYYLERTAIDNDSQTYLHRLKDDLGSVDLGDLPDVFDRYQLNLKKTISPKTGRLLSNQTINHYLKWGRAALNLCRKRRMITSNPLELFEVLDTSPRDRMLSTDEKDKLLSVVSNEAPHLLPILQFALLVPCRRGELLSLQRTDIDFSRMVITIPGTRTKNGRPVIKPIPACMSDYFYSIPADCLLVFYRKERGRYVSLGDFRKSLDRCKKLAKIENWHFHDSRRGAYTELLLAGNTPKSVQQVSGHQTDMSRVYFGLNEMLAAQSIRFADPPKETDKPHLYLSIA